MQIRKETPLYVVDNEGLSEMTLEGLHNCLAGGTRLDEVEVFTDRQQALSAVRASSRRQQVARFGHDSMLRAAKMVLVDGEGHQIEEVSFCPTD